ncbi:MAG: hypothetical protein C5B54_08115 [Acidobacteria bacterium]|nr:MAG: hypothetical protein C5B54_08115 [Acidobacteriota bacterium]
MKNAIHRFYPKAIKSSNFIKTTYEILRNDYQLELRSVLVAESICSDDINSIQHPFKVRQTLGPFNLGGLSGYPFSGLTGMGAFAHHVPEKGAAAIFYAPHIGIGEEGIPGLILRVGQQQASFCCGAVVKALQGNERQDESSANDPIDYQQQALQRLILKSSKRIQNSQNQVTEAVEVIFEASSEMIDLLITHTHFTGQYLFVIGAIMINRDLRSESYVEVRRFDCYNVHSQEKLESSLAKFF